MKCEICNSKIQKNFLGKLFGTRVKIKGKTHFVCSECQSKLGEELKAKLKE